MPIRSSIHGLLLRLGWDVRRVGYPNSEEELLRRFLAVARPDTVLDIGANVGQYARSLRISGFGGRIVSFEAMASPYAQLEAAARDDPKWTVAPRCALGRTRGELEINVANNSVSSSLLAMHDIHLAAAPDSRFVATENVPVERLEDVAQPLLGPGRLMLKVDTQGYEEEVLAGAGSVLAQACALQVELSLVPLYHGAPTLRRMLEICEEAGFALHGLVPGFHDADSGRLLQMDGLFPEERRVAMLDNTPVVKSGVARWVFFATAAVTVAVMFWAHGLAMSMDPHGLTQIFYTLFAVDDYQACMVALGIIVLTVFVSGLLPARRILRWFGTHPMLIAALTVLVLCAGSLFVYLNHPFAMDEYAQYFQSRIFAAGHLHGTFPVGPLDWLVPPGFQNFFLSVSPATGSVASGYWPGFALLLTPFTALGIPWACNPVISALTVLVAHRIAVKLYADQEAAGLVVLLTVASPVIFGEGISYYSMPAHLLANSIYTLLLLEPTRKRALLAGLVGSVALTLHNPVPHILFAIPWIVWLLTRPGGLKLGACLAAGYAPLCIVIGLGWFWFTGHLRQEGMMAVAAAAGGSADADTGALSGMWKTLSVFSIPTGAVFLARFIGIAKIWAWAVPGLMIVACAGAWRYWRVPAIRLLTLSAILTLLGYFLRRGRSGPRLGLSLLPLGVDRAAAACGRRPVSGGRQRGPRESPG